MRTALASPMTKPSRFFSNGRQAVAGSGLVDIARISANALKVRAYRGASAEAATMASAYPLLIVRYASPIAMAPEVQLFEFALLGPVRPYRIAILLDPD